MFKWLKKRFCKHNFKKHWSRASGGYVVRCSKCGKEV